MRPPPRPLNVAFGRRHPVQTALLETSADDGGHTGALIVFPPGHPGSEGFHELARRAAKPYIDACKDAANEDEAVTALSLAGFRSHNDFGPGHRYYEKFVHGKRGEGPMTCVNPRDETVPMRQEGSGDVCAMTEWLQTYNPVPVQGILEGPGAGAQVQGMRAQRRALRMRRMADSLGGTSRRPVAQGLRIHPHARGRRR